MDMLSDDVTLRGSWQMGHKSTAAAAVVVVDGASLREQHRQRKPLNMERGGSEEDEVRVVA